MTPKEKAEQLVEMYDKTLTYLESKSKAKQCALISVDEMLEVLCKYDDISKDYQNWIKVKQEIEKL